MAKLHFISNDIKKKKRKALAWKLVCGLLALTLIIENIYIFYTGV